LLKQNGLAAQAFKVTIKTLPEPDGKARLGISWENDAAFFQGAPTPKLNPDST
jgi:hypothetical protein